MNKPSEVRVWANNDGTVSVSFGSAQTEFKMSFEQAKQEFLGAIQAAEEINATLDHLKTFPEGVSTITSQSTAQVVEDPFRRPPTGLNKIPGS
jgi:hypothetical protein